MQTGIAVLGAGRWGVNLLRNFLAHPQARVVAVVDPRRAQLELCREQFALDRSVVLTTDWQSVLCLPDVEAVAIATPASTHYTLISAALRHQLHVLAEKPLTLDPDEALELCRLAEQQHRQLFVDHTYLFHPAVSRGHEVIKSGSLGEFRYGYATRTHLGPVRQDVDALWDLAIHDIAIFNTWLSKMPTQVQATSTIWLQREREQEDSSIQNLTAKQRVSEADPPDLALSKIPNGQGLADMVWATLTYPDGFQCFLHLCWLNPDKQRRLGVVGSQGTLIFDELQSPPLIIQHGRLEETDDGRYIPINQSREVLNLEKSEPLAIVCDRFLECVRQNRPSPISSGWVGGSLVQILSCLSQSLQAGGRIVKVHDSWF
jgi:predicted dehydrogenase